MQEPKCHFLTKMLAKFKEKLRWQCVVLIDNHLFVQEDDDEVEPSTAHRENDGLKILMCKAILSQTHFFLIVAAALQFVFCMAVFPFITMCMVVWTFSFYPYTSPTLLKTLQFWSLAVLLVKLVYQTPLFHLTSSTSSTSSSGSSTSTSHFWPMLGLMQVVSVPSNTSLDDSTHLGYSSMLSLMGMDIIFNVVLFLHCWMKQRGGRMQESPIAVCRKLHQEEDDLMHLPHEEGSTIAGRISSASSMPRQQQQQQQQDQAVASSSSTAGEQLHSEMADPSTTGERQTTVIAGLQSDAKFYASFRKPPKDLYTSRFVLHLVLLMLLIFFWSAIVGGGRSFSASLSANLFSGRQVISVVVILALAVLDRAAHSWHTAAQVTLHELRAPGLSDTANRHDLISRSVTAWWFRVGLLWLQLLGLHIVCIYQWMTTSIVTNRDLVMWSRFLFTIFYAVYVWYLVLSARQLKYDIHSVQGGLRLCHNTSFSGQTVFKIYSVIPFLEEFRSLIDWTVTETTLDFFMWMKLEDAHQNLYRVTLAMEARRADEKNQNGKRQWIEKLYCGVLGVLVLFLLLAGPLLWFSTAISGLLKDNPIVSGSVDVSLSATNQITGQTSELGLYSTRQATISASTTEEMNRFVSYYPQAAAQAGLTLQSATFPLIADTFWMVPDALRTSMAEQLLEDHTNAKLIVAIGLEGGLTGRESVSKVKVDLWQESTKRLARVIGNNSFQGVDSVIVQSALATNMSLSQEGALSGMGPLSDINLTIFSNSASDFPQWHFASQCLEHRHHQTEGVTSLEDRPRQARLQDLQLLRGRASTEQPMRRFSWFDMWHQAGGGDATGQQPPPTSCPFTVQVASDKAVPDVAGGGTRSTSSMSLQVFYISVVYAVGKFLRLVFQDSSKRVIYEEMEDTKLLRDLCDGIYMSRKAGDLRRERELWKNLIEIFRSPDILKDVSAPRRKARQTPDRDVTEGMRQRGDTSHTSRASSSFRPHID